MKLFILGRRAPGLTRQAAHHHLLHVHGPMVVNAPADAGPLPSPYIQNHVVDGAYPVDMPGLPREIDLVTEINFVDRAAMQAGLATSYYVEHLKPDEPRFVDTTAVVRLPVVSTQSAEGERKDIKFFALGMPEGNSVKLVDHFRGLVAGRAWRAHFMPEGSFPVRIVVEGWPVSFGEAHAWAEALQDFGAIVLIAKELTWQRIMEYTHRC